MEESMDIKWKTYSENAHISVGVRGSIPLLTAILSWNRLMERTRSKQNDFSRKMKFNSIII